MLTEQQKIIHKEFRKYLHDSEGLKKTMLDNYINAAENNLPALIRKHLCADFKCIYDDLYSIEQLLSFSVRIKSDEEILAAPYGYISSKSLDAYIRFYAMKSGVDLDDLMNSFVEESTINETEEENEKRLYEGRTTEAMVLRRQRNRAARERCLVESGYKCYICGFNFEKVYGDIGRGFLEVHHTKPLATYDEEHPIPQSELCALCSNCHSMVHRKREVMDVDELKRLFESNNRNK